MSRRPTAIIRRKALSRSKYDNKRVKVGERTFDSKGERVKDLAREFGVADQWSHDMRTA